MMLLPRGFDEWKKVFELLSYVAIFLGLPTAVFQYRRSKIREQTDREYGTYNALDEKYLDFQKMCFEHPELDIFDIADASPVSLTEEQQKQELVAFTMLISVFERSFLMYHDQSSAVKRAQWTGWDEYIRSYCDRANFRNAWEISGETFDRNFENYVEQILATSILASYKPAREIPGDVTALRTQVISDVTSHEYLAGLKLGSQYGWAGGSLNTNELSFLVQEGGVLRDSVAFVLLRDSLTIGIAIISYLVPSHIAVLHDMIVAQSITRDELFARFWTLILPELRRQFPDVRSVVAEVPNNEPRHLKTEVFSRGLEVVKFQPSSWIYYLPAGFNHRQEPTAGRLFVYNDIRLELTTYLASVHSLYFDFYRPLAERFAPGAGIVERQLRELEALIMREVDAG
jgi:hypothetical protein